MIKRDYANYHVGLKVLLRRGEEFLFLTDAKWNKFDLPGGRIDNIEHYTPLSEIIDRELQEELGEDIKYKLGKPILHFRRHFERESKNFHVFLVVFEGEYLSGEIKLSDEHSKYQWINPMNASLVAGDFFNEEEFFALNSYFLKK